VGMDETPRRYRHSLAGAECADAGVDPRADEAAGAYASDDPFADLRPAAPEPTTSDAPPPVHSERCLNSHAGDAPAAGDPGVGEIQPPLAPPGPTPGRPGSRFGLDARTGLAPDPTSPDYDPCQIVGHVWQVDGVSYRRANNGQLLRWSLVPTKNHKSATGKWNFVKEAGYKTKLAQQTEQAVEKLRTSDSEPLEPTLAPKPTTAGIEDLPDADRVRIKLRQHQRALDKRALADAPVKLTTLADVHSLAFAIRYIEGGRDSFIAFVQGAMLEGLPESTAWFRVYADLTAYERKIASLDDICAAAGVRPSKLVSEIVTTRMDLGRDVGNLVAAALHPQVVAALAKSGSTLDGANPEISHKDRIAFLQGMGTLPLPKGVVINNTVTSNAAAAAMAAAAEPSMPSFAQDMRGVTTTRTIGQRALAASTDDVEWKPPARTAPQPAVIEVPSTEDEAES